MQGCIKRMWRRGVSACVVATGKGDVGRILLRVDAGRKRVFVPPPGMVSQTSNSWLPRSPHPSPGPRRPVPLGVVTPQAAIGRVRLTFAGHRAFFAPRMTMGKVARCPRSLDFMQTAMNENVNVKISTCIMSVTTRLVWHVHAGPGARAARPHTSSAPPRPPLFLHVLVPPPGMVS